MLESSEVNISKVPGEWDDMLKYSQKYIGLVPYCGGGFNCDISASGKIY